MVLDDAAVTPVFVTDNIVVAAATGSAHRDAYTVEAPVFIRLLSNHDVCGSVKLQGFGGFHIF